MNSCPRVALVYQSSALPWIFRAAERVPCEIVLVPRPGDDVTVRDAPSPVVDTLQLDVLSAPAESISLLHDYRARRGLDGILTWYDPAVPFTARAAAALGLPGVPVDAARRSTDKVRLRERMAEYGAAVPPYVNLGREHRSGELQPVADLRFPLVVKPAGGYSSLGVVRVNHFAELESAVAEVRDVCRRQLPPEALDRGILVEEYLEGPEYVVENFVLDGRTNVLTVGYKGHPTGPYFEEGIYRAPADLDAATLAALRRETALVNSAVGITGGPVHTEARLVDGQPVVFDVGARVGGSGVSAYIVEETTDVDLARHALEFAVGEPLAENALTPNARGYAANYIVPCGGSGVIASIDGLDALRARSGCEVVQFLEEGDVVRPFPAFSGYPAFVLSSHGSVADAADFHEKLRRTVRVSYSE